MDARNETLSISELYVIGKERYFDNQTGLENWKADLFRFTSEEFHKKLNSSNRKEQKKANEEISLWMNTTHISFFFKGSWGEEIENKSRALQYLHHAQILERKYNDQFVIQVINQAIKACNENKYQLMA